MSGSKLPADPLSLIMGISAILLVIVGCCGSIILFPFAIIAALPLIIAIVGIIAANRSLRLYRADPEIYSKRSKDNVVTARIVNIIGLVFSLFCLLYFLIQVFTVGDALYDFLNQEGNFKIQETYEGEPLESDILQLEDIDSLSTDSIFLEEVYPEGDNIE